MKSIFHLALVILIASCGISVLSATTISSTVLETNTQQQLSTTDPAELTVPTGYDFTSQPFGSLSSIATIQVTLTLQDAQTTDPAVNSDPDFNYDFNHLFLALDGINTGIALNGFPGGGLQATLSISGSISPATSTALLAQFADGIFVGSIITDNTVDTALAPNDIFVGNDAGNALTTLIISDVPEPSAVALMAAGLISLIALQIGRSRRRI